MQENRRNRKRILGSKTKNYQDVVTSLEEIEEAVEKVSEEVAEYSFIGQEDTRGGKCKPQKPNHCHVEDNCDHNHNHHHDCDHNHNHNHHHDCDHNHNHHHHCEPCGVGEDNAHCSKNQCADECGIAYQPAKFSTSNAIPYAIEANRVFDTMLIQAMAEIDEPIDGEDIEVVMVSGPGPRFGEASVKIDDVCIRYDSIEIIPGDDPEPDGIFLDDYEICKPADGDCEVYNYQVAGKVDDTCNTPGAGRSVSYKQRGLKVKVNGLTVELSGKCGCTSFTAITDVEDKIFSFNTIGGAVVVPADGRSFTLRQEYQTALKVDCIGRATLYCDCDCKGRPVYGLSVPSGIDVVCCLQELVSILVNEQIVVLGSCTPVRPRISDAFSNVCNFQNPSQGDGTSNNGCGCFRD